jgi:RHH-type proline utilization regulon transcriptional repressor/proline dehydrogenase/delta 1-pyrroline-5-carboxylate dehydrogenase
VIGRAHVGNIYVNRNVVGAVVGVQPFGGEGLSGTGPKAGGALYLQRLLAKRPAGLPKSLIKHAEATANASAEPNSLLKQFSNSLLASGVTDIAQRIRAYPEIGNGNVCVALRGPTGEHNAYSLMPRGTVLCMPETLNGARVQFAAALATGNRARFVGSVGERFVLELPPELRSEATVASDLDGDAVLFEGERDVLLSLLGSLAGRKGPVVSVQTLTASALAAGEDYVLERLVTERSVSTNTTAAGGNAQLMTTV